MLIVLDTLLSLLSHWISKDVSSEGFGMIAKKLIVYSAVMILSHVLANYSVDGSAITTLQWFRTFSCSFLMVREALSIVEKIEAVLPGFFPESIINHLKNFNNNNNNNKEVLR